MASRVDEFLTNLHREYLKPKGFQKKGRAFQREHQGYSEIYEVSGVKHHPGDESAPWAFLMYGHVLFRDLPTPLLGFGRQRAHWILQLPWPSRERPLPRFLLSPGENEEKLAGDIASLVEAAGADLALNVAEVRNQVIQNNKRDALRLNPEEDDTGIVASWRAVLPVPGGYTGP
jgi:hypothetical protein